MDIKFKVDGANRLQFCKDISHFDWHGDSSLLLTIRKKDGTRQEIPNVRMVEVF